MIHEWSCETISPAGSLRVTAGILAVFGFACYLVFFGWRIPPIFLLVVLELVLGCKFAVLWLDYLEEASQRGKCFLQGLLLSLGRICLGLSLCVAFTAAWWSHRYAVVMDPTTTLRWIASTQLSHELDVHPQTRVIMLQDGFAEMSSEGRYARETCTRQQCVTTHFSVAPVYSSRSAAVGGGEPLAWAVGLKEVAPEYCAGGLCGVFRGRLRAEGPLDETSGEAKAAMLAAAAGGFSYKDGLPMIETTDLVEHAQYAQWWHLRFWWLFWGSVTLAFATDANAIVALRKRQSSPESLPLASS